jgi:uncharacterized protein
MNKTSSGIVFSASDLVNFLECRHLTSLDRQHLDTPLPKTPADEQTLLVRRKGEQHECTYLEALERTPTEVVKIPTEGLDLDARVHATLTAMRAGVNIIYQASFRADPFMGYADFLRRVERPSTLGAYSYEVLDTKLARTTKSSFIIQLACYSDLLSLVQGVPPLRMHVVLGNGTEASFPFSDYRFYFARLKQRFLDQLATLSPAQTYPVPCERCDICHWRELCEARRTQDDHLSLVANISQGQVQKLETEGVTTLQALARLPEGTTIPKMNPAVLARLRHQASLQYRSRQDGKPLVELIPPDTSDGLTGRKGFARLPRPDPGDLYFDMEGDPLEEGGLEYLFGLYFVEDGAPQFKPFWGHDRQEERYAFEAFIDFVMAHLQRHPQAYIYHYAPYEKTALRNLMQVHGTREAEVDHLLRTSKLVDLYAVVREGIRVSEPSYSLKYIEHFYLEKRAGDVTSAGASIVYYERWKDTRDPALLKQIEDYNHDDVRSTFGLHRWLLTLRPPDMPWADLAPPPAEEEPTTTSRIVQTEERLALYRQQLLDPLPKDRETWSARAYQDELVFLLLDAHRRAAKPQWWQIFERQNMTPAERLDDLGCIAGLELDPAKPPRPEKRSIRYTYRYPEQEAKLKTGDSVRIVDPPMSVSDFTRDDDTWRVTFKVGASRTQPPVRLDVGLGGPLDDTKLREAVCRYADAYLARSRTGEESDYPAIDSFLAREIPCLKGRKPGEPIIPATGDPQSKQQSIIDAVALLDGSYLFMQGPPGTGKTYTASHVIVELLRQGKRIGVSSNSHKAIVNLLHAVELAALERGVTFKGAKKQGAGDDSDRVNGRFVLDVESTKEILEGKYQLIAGTAWLFSEPALDRTLDYLFIDEAGQVSLANVVAVGVSARNLVLLGDQMQLGQPTQGKHPGQSGLSTLEYLLKGQSTVSPDRGIFLDVTWRMHPDICRFISDAVYDGRLEPHPNTVRRILVLKPGAHPALKAAGIRYLPVDHQGCSQSSPEEADVAYAIYASLLEQAYLDEQGNTHRIEPNNILVVAPYNMQVALLKRTLPASARVGTVDKFQGQEAEVVIISMATSSGEDLSRHIEFLYSRNRLNVAISRAKCLAILIANPALMSIPCRTPEQMALVNTLCRVATESAPGIP